MSRTALREAPAGFCAIAALDSGVEWHGAQDEQTRHRWRPKQPRAREGSPSASDRRTYLSGRPGAQDSLRSSSTGREMLAKVLASACEVSLRRLLEFYVATAASIARCRHATWRPHSLHLQAASTPSSALRPCSTSQVCSQAFAPLGGLLRWLAVPQAGAPPADLFATAGACRWRTCPGDAGGGRTLCG